MKRQPQTFSEKIMKKLFKLINIISAIVFFASALCVDHSDTALIVCFISIGYCFIYVCGKDIFKAVVKYVAEAFME